MEKRNIYVTAAIISLFFYFVGVMSGLFLEKSMEDYTNQRFDSVRKQIEGLQLEYAYLSIIGDDLSCDSLYSLTDETTRKVRELGNKLEAEDSLDSDNLGRDYAVLSIKAWIMNRYLLDRCEGERVVFLYFYSIPCEECLVQGRILDDLVAGGYKDKLIIFVLNRDLDEPIVNMLKKAHNIGETPAIVVGNMTYTGLLDEDSLEQIISDHLNESRISS